MKELSFKALIQAKEQSLKVLPILELSELEAQI